MPTRLFNAAQLFAVALLASSSAVAASEHATPQAAPQSYRSLRYDEDYSYLRDPSRRTDLLDPLKYFSLNAAGSSYLSLGGEIREWYEFYENSLWGAGPQDSDGYLLQRFMLHADLHLGPRIRVSFRQACMRAEA